MKTLMLALTTGAVLLSSGMMSTVAFAAASPLADAGRPPEDVARDAARKPMELIAFSGLKAGDRVIDFIPATGYWSKIFSGVVGPTGGVFATVPAQVETRFAPMTAKISEFAATHANVKVVIDKGSLAPADGPVDMLWTAQNYHDLYNGPNPGVITIVNKAVFAALKPGGVYLIIDHSAPAGSGVTDTNTLHRIDEAAVRKDVEAAGFVFDASSDVLRNAADTRMVNVFDPAIRGKTDQFVLKFHKPK